jgi:hypothetical protein
MDGGRGTEEGVGGGWWMVGGGGWVMEGRHRVEPEGGRYEVWGVRQET